MKIIHIESAKNKRTHLNMIWDLLINHLNEQYSLFK